MKGLVGDKKKTKPTQTHQQPVATGQEYKVRIQGKTHIKDTKMNMTINILMN